MSSEKTDKRVATALQCLHNYEKTLGLGSEKPAEPLDLIIIDFLADIQHVCEAKSYTFGDLLSTAIVHYSNEKET